MSTFTPLVFQNAGPGLVATAYVPLAGFLFGFALEGVDPLAIARVRFLANSACVYDLADSADEDTGERVPICKLLQHPLYFDLGGHQALALEQLKRAFIEVTLNQLCPVGAQLRALAKIQHA